MHGDVIVSLCPSMSRVSLFHSFLKPECPAKDVYYNGDIEIYVTVET